MSRIPAPACPLALSTRRSLLSNPRARTVAAQVASIGVALLALTPPAIAGGGRVQGEPAPRLVLFASTGPAVQVLVDGRTRFDLPAGGEMAVRTRADSLRYLVTHGEAWQYGGALDLRGQTERLVMISAPSSHLRIINRGGEDAEILFESRSLGVLPKDGVRLWGPLPPGRRRLVAVGVRSRSWSVLDITLRPGATRTAVLPAPPSGLVIENTIDEPVRVAVDQQDHGALEAGGSMTVLGLAPGSHLVELRGLKTGHSWRYDSKLGERGASAADAGPLHLWLENRTGETVRLPPSLGGLYDRPVTSGERVRLIMPRKAVRLSLRGDDSGLSYERDVLPDPAEQSWVMRRPKGHVRLVNGTGEACEVSVGGHHKLKLSEGGRVQLRGVPAGKLKLIVKTVRSGERFERGLFLEPRGDITWTVTAGAASLLVRNDWPEPVELSIDGAGRGQIQAGGVFRAGQVRPGVHEVLARATVAGRVDAALVKVVDGKRATLVLRPPDCSLRVDNHSGERYDVLVRGVEVGRVPPGASRTFATAPGYIVAEVRGARSGLHASWAGKLGPAQHLPLPTPGPGGGAIELRNDLAAVVSLKIGRRDPVELAPGKHIRVEGLAAGEHLVEVRGEGFVQRQRVLVIDGQPPVVIAMLPSVLAETAPREAKGRLRDERRGQNGSASRGRGPERARRRGGSTPPAAGR